MTTVTRGVVFSCYDVRGVYGVSVTVEDGVVVGPEVPEEMTAAYARALGAVLTAAADELELQMAPVMVPAGYVDIGGGIYAEAGREALGGGK